MLNSVISSHKDEATRLGESKLEAFAAQFSQRRQWGSWGQQVVTPVTSSPFPSLSFCCWHLQRSRLEEVLVHVTISYVLIILSILISGSSAVFYDSHPCHRQWYTINRQQRFFGSSFGQGEQSPSDWPQVWRVSGVQALFIKGQCGSVLRLVEGGRPRSFAEVRSRRRSSSELYERFIQHVLRFN